MRGAEGERERMKRGRNEKRESLSYSTVHEIIIVGVIQWKAVPIPELTEGYVDRPNQQRRRGENFGDNWLF